MSASLIMYTYTNLQLSKMKFTGHWLGYSTMPNVTALYNTKS